MANYKEKVEAKEEDFDELAIRQDEDVDLLHLKKYVMKDAKNHVIRDIVNVTLNRPGVFGANIISALGNTSEQLIISSNDENFDTRLVEDFRNVAFAAADYRLKKQNKSSLDDFIDIQSCIRGRSAARCLFRRKNGVLIPDIMPWDAHAKRVTYELGEDGLEWAAYKTKRYKDDIEAKYPEARGMITDKTATVLDVWDATHNEIWVNDRIVKEQGHNYGFTPVCIEIVPLGYGSALMDDDRLKYDGESIFFLIRDAVPELNRLVSIMQTLNLKAVKPPMKYKSKEGHTSKPPKPEAIEMAKITSLDAEGDLAPINYGDAQRSAQLAYNMMKKDMEEGSLSSIDLGILDFQVSAVALIEIGEGRDQVFLPRLKAKAGLKEQIGDMFTKQVIQMGGSVELGVPGHKRTFKVSDLKGEYSTSYKYFVKSPKIDMARHSVANAAIEVSRKYKREHMLQLEDPEGEDRQRTIEEAQETSPILKLEKRIKALLDAGMDEEADLLSMEEGVAIEALLRGELVPNRETAVKPQQMPNLFGGPVGISGEASSAKKAADLQRTPEEGE